MLYVAIKNNFNKDDNIIMRIIYYNNAFIHVFRSGAVVIYIYYNIVICVDGISAINILPTRQPAAQPVRLHRRREIIRP